MRTPRTVSAIAREFGVAPRTIHRDLRALRNQGFIYTSSRRPGAGIQVPATWNETSTTQQALLRHYEGLIRQLPPTSVELLNLLALSDSGWGERELSELTRVRADSDLRLDLDAAMDAGLIARRSSRFEFESALARQSVAYSMNTATRAELSARIVDLLRSSPPADNPSQSVAHHALEAGSHIGPGQATRILVEAAEEANVSGEYRKALDWCDRADSAGLAVTDADAAMLAEQRAIALYRMDHRDEAFTAISLSFQLYRSAKLTDEALRVAAYPLAVYWKPELVDLLEDAMQLAPEHSVERATLLSRYGMAVGQGAGDLQGGREAFRKAADIFRSTSDVDQLLWTCTRGAAVCIDHLDIESGAAFAGEALELGVRSKSPEATQYSHDRAAKILMIKGDAIGARLHGLAALREAERSGAPTRKREAMVVAQAVFSLTAEFKSASRYADEVISRLVKGNVTPHFVVAQRALFSFELGDEATGQRFLDDAVNLLGSSRLAQDVFSVSAMALIADRFDRRHLFRLVVPVLEVAKQSSWLPVFGPILLTMEALAWLNNATEADPEEMLRQVHRHKSTVPGISNSHLRVALDSLDQIAGRIESKLGRYDRAKVHFEHAIDAANSGHSRAERLRTTLQMLTLLSGPDGLRGHGDPEHMAAQAGEEARGIGMEGLARRFDELRAPGHTSATASPLTDRQSEILELVALGLTNAEIASRLVISEHTVIGHVRNLLIVLQAANRAEAVSNAYIHGLLPGSSGQTTRSL